jgi:16S rRNA (guanine1516-N2)-methyltransferase
MSDAIVSLICSSEPWLSNARLVARDLGIPLNDSSSPLQLHYGEQGWGLAAGDMQSLQVKFSWEEFKKKRQEGKSRALIKACKPKPQSTIVDVTAGWGRDAALLASFGANLLLVERNPIMQLLLQDALDRRDDASRSHLNLSLISGEAMVWLDKLQEENYPDVIYIDPMHPARSKKALVKKDLQLLQKLIGPDCDATALVEKAIGKARERVVVKWPQKQAPLIQPNYSVEGKTVRYDCYC